MKPVSIVVWHRFPESEKRLREQLKQSQYLFNQLKRDYHSLERIFGYEVLLNGELIDILNEHNISFRDRLEYRKHPF